VSVAAARRVLLTTVAVLAASPTVASAAYAPVDHAGPALSVPAPALSAALQCSPGVDHPARAPVLLVPGAGSNPTDNYSWNYEPALSAKGIGWCALTLPDNANDDVQTAGEYVVSAIRTMYARAGRRIAIIGHSQGGMVPRWALRFWPDTRAMVDDLIAFAPSNHGTTQARVKCAPGLMCTAADWQQRDDSSFIAALNSGQETFPGISYTDVYTHTDEIVEPNLDSNGSSSLHGGGGRITNVAVQDVCPVDTSEHLALGTYDNVAYNLAIDALGNDGPADPARVPPMACVQLLMPGVNPATFLRDAGQALIDDQTSTAAKYPAEPPLACYVTLSCGAAGQSATAPRCLTGRRLLRVRAPRGHRVVVIGLKVDGRLVLRRRGRRLTRIAVPPLAAGGHVLTLEETLGSGHHRAVAVHVRVEGCLSRATARHRRRGHRRPRGPRRPH